MIVDLDKLLRWAGRTCYLGEHIKIGYATPYNEKTWISKCQFWDVDIYRANCHATEAEARAAVEASVRDGLRKGVVQPPLYHYIGRDGKTVLARELEDERDRLAEELSRLRDDLEKGAIKAAAAQLRYMRQKDRNL